MPHIIKARDKNLGLRVFPFHRVYVEGWVGGLEQTGTGDMGIAGLLNQGKRLERAELALRVSE